MGLDMYLYAEKYFSGYDFNKDPNYDAIVAAAGMSPSPDSPSLTVRVTVAYWRKVNAVHQWFVDSVQEGVDDCRDAYVTRETLVALLDACREVLRRPEQAGDILPTQAGFFFGGTEYDEYYFEDLRDTVEQLERVLTDPLLSDCDFYYHSSW